MFVNPMLSDGELSTLYPDDYYAYQDRGARNQGKEILKKLLGIQLKTCDPAFSVPGRMLDLGCGTGWYLSEMRALGWEVHGVEISARAAELGRTRYGLNIFPGTLRSANFPSDFFHYIRANHSFEHISCPGETLDEIRRILRRDGKVLIGVPNVDGLNARLFRQYWWYLGVPVHPFTYSALTLSHLLEQHKFVVQRVSYNSDYSGILGSAQIWLNRNNGKKSTEGLLIRNPVFKVLCHWAAKGIDLLHLGDAIEVIATKAGEAA